MIKTLIKEPLVHFLILGLGLFVLFAYVGPEEGDNEIVIDEYDLNEIISKWKLQWQREPTQEELKGLLDGYIKEEIMYREALAMNLDHNDEIVRRRMAQKIQFLTQDLVESSDPTQEQLQAYLEANQDKYYSDATFSFRQIYFNPDSRENAMGDAQKALENPQPKGDRSPVREEAAGLTADRVRSIYGKKFLEGISTLKVNSEWQGPITSGLGFHLVRLDQLQKPEALKLEEAFDRILTDYRYDMRQALNEDLFNGLLEKYEVDIQLDGDVSPEWINQ